jgi:hypothetical protein
MAEQITATRVNIIKRGRYVSSMILFVAAAFGGPLDGLGLLARSKMVEITDYCAPM